MLDQAEQYFSTRIHSEAWESASAETKAKALATAERQINTLKLRRDVDMVAKQNAIYEQALFLLQLTPYDIERQKAQALGVIGGSIGNANEYSSAEIVRSKMQGLTIAPEAQVLLAEYVSVQRSIGGGLR